MLEIVAIGQVERARREGARVVDDVPVGVDQGDDVGLRQANVEFLEEIKGALPAEDGAKFLGCGEARRRDLPLQLDQRHVDRLHRVGGLLGKHGREIAGVVPGVLHRILVQADDRQHGGEHRERDQRSRGGDQPAKGKLAPSVRHFEVHLPTPSVSTRS